MWTKLTINFKTNMLQSYKVKITNKHIPFSKLNENPSKTQVNVTITMAVKLCITVLSTF